LDEQQVRRFDVIEELLQHERGVFAARGDRRDLAHFDVRNIDRTISQQQRSRKADVRGGLAQRAHGEQRIRGVDAAQRDGGKLKHRQPEP
jgi:hypothetical protein